MYAASQEEIESSCHSILASGVQCLGFDIEWHVTYRHGIKPSPLIAAHIAVAAHLKLNAYDGMDGSKACGRTS